jgi:hypothetical protein
VEATTRAAKETHRHAGLIQLILRIGKDDANGTSTESPLGFLVKCTKAAFNKGDAALQKRCVLQILVLSRAEDSGYPRARLTKHFYVASAGDFWGALKKQKTGGHTLLAKNLAILQT